MYGVLVLSSDGAGALSLASDNRGQIQVGSLTGAVHLSNDNAGVPRLARRRRKRRVERKGKRRLDLDLRYGYGPRKRGLTILLTRGFRREVSEKLPQG